MNVSFQKEAWQDYQYFHKQNIKIVEKIHSLIKDISRTPFTGLGKPEPLKHYFTGAWSRRIDQEHRLIYAVQDNTIYIIQCKYHY